jgi:HTH-type transcriptional regulator/antitoxin HigA
MPPTLGFSPNWVSAPGDTIADILRERNLSVADLAHHMGDSPEQVTDLLQGRASITLGIARRLEAVLGASVEFWMARDFQYREDTARLYPADNEWLGELPLGDMIQFGWLKPVPRPSEEMAACLRFFNVPDVAAWRKTYAKVEEMVAFRTSPSFDSRPGSVAAWLRKGELESEAIRCGPWNAERFEESLARIRRLTKQKHPSRFIPELRGICAACGVAVVIVRAPSGCRASGVTRFISQNRALLLLSFRYLSDDQFWFTFFHEAGHLLVHGKAGFFLEGLGGPTTREEDEANQFAARTLIPPEFHQKLLRLPVNGRKVIRFAHEVGISAGIVVGQLQHYGRATQRQLNNLKRRFSWQD